MLRTRARHSRDWIVALALLAWSSGFAFAQTTVDPNNLNNLVNPIDPVDLQPVAPTALVNDNTIYIARDVPSASAGGWVDPAFPKVDVDLDPTSDTNPGKNQVFLDFQSSLTFSPTGNQRVILVLQAKISGGGWQTIPIASAGVGQGSPPTCTDQGAQGVCQAVNTFKGDIPEPATPMPSGTPVPDGTRGLQTLHAARFVNGQFLRVGIYPKDICWEGYYANQSLVPIGCLFNAGGVPYQVDTSSVTTTFNLRALLYIASDYATLVRATNATINSREFTLVIQSNAPTRAACNANESYFPSDSSILYNTNEESLTYFPVSGGAPILNTVVIAKEGTSASILDTSEAGYASNGVIQAVKYRAGYQSVAGFRNATLCNPDCDVQYEVGASARDAAGFVSNQFCTTFPASAMEVETFIKSGRCFIATAAYRDPKAPQVERLRQFRDRVLKRFSLGRSFVDFYYAHSEPAAEWLMEHSVFRYPVLAILAPIQLFAAIALEWGVGAAVAFGLAGFFAVFFGVSRLYRRRSGGRKRSAGAAAGIAIVGVLCLGVSLSARAQESAQPYIDRLKETMPEPDSGTAPEGGYIESIRSRMNQPSDDSEGYTERLKRSLRNEGQGEARGEEGYSDALRKRADEAASKDPDADKSPIRAVTEGQDSALKLKRPGNIHHAVGFRTGGSTGLTMVNPESTLAFFEIYEKRWAPNFQFFYEYQPFHSEWFGNIGFFGSAGMTFYGGIGKFTQIVPKPVTGFFSQNSRTSLTFMVIPVTLGVSYRFNLLRVVRPYVMAGGTAVGFWEGRDDERGDGRTYGFGFQGTVGVAIPLDFISRELAWNQYDENGFKRFYLTVELSKLKTVSGDISMDNTGIYGGFTFEL